SGVLFCFFSSQGQRERDQCYKPILDELNRLFPDRSTSRCTDERNFLLTGFVSQGNEFSYYMMICSSFILNQ
ncbi:hypothetical protein EJ110_NYTH51768, partial [Nymphaea thermarum]